MLNVVALMGRLTADPELRTTPSNVPVTTFTLAVNRSYVKQGAERVADFINIVAWRHTAEFVCRYFRKGQLVAVDGSIQTRSYTDKDGNKRTAFEVVASNVHFAESKNSSGGNSAPAPTHYDDANINASFAMGSTDDFEEIESDDDLPF